MGGTKVFGTAHVPKLVMAAGAAGAAGAGMRAAGAAGAGMRAAAALLDGLGETKVLW